MLETIIEALATYVILPALGALAVKLLGKANAAKAKKRAIEILQDESDPITSPKDALQKAFYELFQKRMDADVAEIEQLQREGAIQARARAAQLAADKAAGNVPDVTVVPRDGTEEFRSPWKDPPK